MQEASCRENLAYCKVCLVIRASFTSRWKQAHFQGDWEADSLQHRFLWPQLWAR